MLLSPQLPRSLPAPSVPFPQGKAQHGHHHLSARLQPPPPPSNHIHADSIEHDIAGASAAGIDSLLIAGGIHAGELLGGEDGAAGVDGAGLEALCARHGVSPTHSIPFLSW